VFDLVLSSAWKLRADRRDAVQQNRWRGGEFAVTGRGGESEDQLS
jgi:hypothetical protein